MRGIESIWIVLVLMGALPAVLIGVFIGYLLWG